MTKKVCRACIVWVTNNRDEPRKTAGLNNFQKPQLQSILLLFSFEHPCLGPFVLGSLSKGIYETRTATGREHFTCRDGGVSKIFILIISNGEEILSTINVVEWSQVERENRSLPVAVRVSKTRELKLPNIFCFIRTSLQCSKYLFLCFAWFGCQLPVTVCG